MNLLVLSVFIFFIEYSFSFRELFTLDCNRRVHITPYLPTSTGMDVSGYLSILNAAFEEMLEQSKGMCPDMTDEEFNNRFGVTLPQGFIRLFELEKFEKDACEQRYRQEIAVFHNFFKAIFPENTLPETCNYETAPDGKCHFAVELEPFTLQFAFEECPTYPGETAYNRIPFISVTCDGCDTLLKPCTRNVDCGDGMKCDYYEGSYNQALAWLKGKTTLGSALFSENDFYEFGFFDDLMAKALRKHDFITDFVHSIAMGYWGSAFDGKYDAYKFCFADLDGDHTNYLNKFDVSSCVNVTIPDDPPIPPIPPVDPPTTCYNILWSEDNVCTGHGVCNEIDECICLDGWTGVACEMEPLDVVYCYGKWEHELGVCSDNGICQEDGTCACSEGHYGDECDSIASCFGYSYLDTENACGGRGTCTLDEVCVCDDPYYTPAPTTENPEPAPCSGVTFCGDGIFYYSGEEPDTCGAGVCSFVAGNSPEQYGECKCDEYTSGMQCEEDRMCNNYLYNENEACGEFGVCEQDGTCTCPDGVSGDKCEIDSRTCGIHGYNDPYVCYEHGDCLWTGEQYECDCYDEYDISDGCYEKTTCFNKVVTEACNQQGTCADKDNCECFTNFYGEQCEFTRQCNGVDINSAEVCGGHGICTIDGNCVCDEEYFGSDCQYAVTCGGYDPRDPLVCDGINVCTVNGCSDPFSRRRSEDDTTEECYQQLFGIFSPWDGVMENGDIANSDLRRSGQTFKTQINRIHMEYDPTKPIPLFVYNGDGVGTVLPSHKYLGFAVYLQEMDRLLVLLDEFFTSLRKYHSDISDVVQKYYYKYWSPMPWLFRFTSFNAENHLKWRRNHYNRRLVRILKGYELPSWFKLIEPPMSCTVPQYRDFGNCTLRVKTLGKFFGGELDLYFKFRRDQDDGPNDYTGFPHMEVWCDGELCHEMYSLKRCEDNTDCKSGHCQTFMQTTDYRLPTYVTKHAVFEVIENDGTEFHYSFWDLTALFFEGGLFRMDFSDNLLHPLSFYKNMLALITGTPRDTELSEELNICTLNRKEDWRVRHGHHRGWGRLSFWKKFTNSWMKYVKFDKVQDFWKSRSKWWKRGGKWWKDGDDDDDDDNDRRSGWRDWWKKRKNRWKKKDDKDDDDDKKIAKDEEYVTKIEGLESWNELFCLKKGGDACGCVEGMLNCVCYEFSEDKCENYFNTPQEDVFVVPGVKYNPQDNWNPGPDDDGVQDGEITDSAASMVVMFTVVCGIVAVLF